MYLLYPKSLYSVTVSPGHPLFGSNADSGESPLSSLYLALVTSSIIITSSVPSSSVDFAHGLSLLSVPGVLLDEIT